MLSKEEINVDRIHWERLYWRDGTSTRPLKKARLEYVECKERSRAPDQQEHRFGIRNSCILFWESKWRSE